MSSVENSERTTPESPLKKTYIDRLGAMKILLQTEPVALRPSDAAEGRLYAVMNTINF